MTLVEWYDNNEQNILDNISLKVKYNDLSSQFGAPTVGQQWTQTFQQHDRMSPAVQYDIMSPSMVTS